MNQRTLDIIRRTSKIAGITAGILALIIAIIVNFIITPGQLTPLARQYAKEYLDADVKISSVQATFFSSFPRFGIKVDSVTVVSHAFHHSIQDSIYHRRDTLATFSELRAGIDLWKTITSGNFVIGRAKLTDAHIRLYTDSIGRSNWDIIKSDTTNVTSTDTTESNFDLSLRHIELVNARFRYANKLSQVYFGFDGMNMTTDGDINLESLDIDVELQDRKTSLKIDNTRYLRRLPIGLNGHIFYDYNDNKYKFGNACFVIDGHDIDIDGWFQTDSTGINVDVNYELASPSVEKLFALIPQDIIGNQLQVENGSIDAKGFIRGRYDNYLYPVVNCNVNLDKIHAHYEGMKQSIEDVSAKFDAVIDAQHPDDSFLNLEIFHFKGGKSEVESNIKATQLLADANIFAHIKADIDLKSILEVFPFRNTQMKGKLSTDLTTDFRISDITTHNYGRIKANGIFDADGFTIINDTLGFTLATDMHGRFNGQDTLKAGIRMSYFDFSHPHANIHVTDFKGGGKTVLTQDTTVIAPLSTRFTANRLTVNIDSVSLFFKNMLGSTILKPLDTDKHKPHIEVSLKSDTIISNIFSIQGITHNLDAHSMLELVADSTWHSDMYTEFKRVIVNMPKYSIPLIATDTRITQAERTIDIQRSHLVVGKSTMDIKASIHNLYYSLFRHQPLKASLEINADTINCNELLSAYIDAPQMTVSTTQSVSDTTYTDDIAIAVAQSSMTADNSGDSIPARLIIIPDRIRFSLKTKVKSLIYNNLSFNDINGNIEVNQGCIHATNIRFKQGNSQAISIMAYKGDKARKKADLNAFIRWERADIGELITNLQLDTIMPMLNSFKGIVDCYMTVKTELDSTMTPDLMGTSLSMHFGGKKLTLLDGDTFKRISKILMFKNKKENLIDTLSFNVLIDSGKINVLPFAMTMDRYTAAIGGSQDFNMNLDYHISILKSPLPFKAGITIKGNINNLNWDSFDLTKAKLKHKVNESDLVRNDSISLNKRVATIRETYFMSGMPMPPQLQTESERQQKELEERMKAAIKAAEEAHLQFPDSTDNTTLTSDATTEIKTSATKTE